MLHFRGKGPRAEGRGPEEGSSLALGPRPSALLQALGPSSPAPRILLLVFAFCAWSLTAPANLALALLVLLFLWDLPSGWPRLRRDPAFWLLVGVVLVTALLAVRASLLFPDTAGDQWHGVSAWTSPFLFAVVAWWVRAEPEQVWDLLIAAPLGLALGVLRKSDWSLLPQVLGGMRYHFGYAALGLAFLVSVLLVGLWVFRARILATRVRGRPRPWLGWTLWIGGLAFALAILVVTQSRGAALMLAGAGLLYALMQARSRGVSAEGPRTEGRGPRKMGISGPWPLALASGALIVALAAGLVWSTWDRQVYDWQELKGSGRDQYNGSLAIRLNLIDVGTTVFAQRPLLGFGPGTSTTEYLVPRRLVAVADSHLAHVPEISHLHSVPLEILTRFGLLGATIAAALIAVLVRAYRGLWRDPQMAPDLRVFLTLGGIMTLLYCIYDFRIVNLDLRFFFILFFGLVYGLYLARQEPQTRRHADA